MRYTLVVVLIAGFVGTACRNVQTRTEQKQQAAEKPEGLSISDWTDRTELFMEYPALVAGETARFAVHFTRLGNFKPVKEGAVEVQLQSADGVQRFSTTGPSRPGIFGVDVKPAKAGTYTMTVELRSRDLTDKHSLGNVTVYGDLASASEHPVEKKQEETIAFLKEQQWALEFATEVVSQRSERAGFEVPAEVQPRAGGQGQVTVPLDGRLVEASAIPVGRSVSRGDVLARIAPPTTAPGDLAAVELAKAEAENALRFARRDRERAQRLVDAGAAPARRLEEARMTESASEARIKAAEARLAQYETTREADAQAGTRLFAVRAPISGAVVESHAISGANVRAGDVLYRIVDTNQVYVAANVPEAELARLRQVTGAELEVPGLAMAIPIGRMVAQSQVIDPASRTASVLYDVNNVDRRLAIGQAVTMRLFTSVNTTAPAVKESAIVDDAGRPVVFVQLAGEAFARRPVTLGNRRGEFVQVLEGVKPGERVVTKGAYLIRLSAMSSQIPAHGHVH